MGIMSLIGLINLERDEGRMSVQCSKAKTFKKYLGISSKKKFIFLNLLYESIEYIVLPYIS